jgi:hypothetical protein
MAWFLDNYTLPHIQEELDQILADAVFKPFRRAQWVRYWGWKSDHLYITKDTRQRFSFNCEVWAAPWPENDELGIGRSFDGITLPWMLNKPGGEFHVPTIPFFLPKFRADIIESIRTVAIDWFDRCDTPAKSLAVCRSRPYESLTSPAFKHLVRYVGFLPKELENVACLVDPPAPLHNDYQRDLFIPPSRQK